MSIMSRRSFIKVGTVASVLASGTVAKSMAKVKGANDRIRIGIAGVRSKGAHHIELFGAIPQIEIAALCDPDQAILEREKTKLQANGNQVMGFADVRSMLDTKDLDAVVIASPNHWHSLMAIWACQAGKDVYVEKPISHNVWEGRKLVEAARKYNRIVQTGTQSRSDEALYQAFAYVNEGNLGPIKLVRGFCYKRRKSIGKVPGPQPIPDSVDFDLWTGPAPLHPLMRTRLHYDWHWQWATGNGDIGNQGVHEMDMCRWAVGQDRLPDNVVSIGGRFGYQDDGETPNTQAVFFDYKPVPIIFEVRGLPSRKDQNFMDSFKGIRIGLVIECEDGYFAGGAGGGWMYDKKGAKIKQFSSEGGSTHHINFINAMQSRKVSDLNADVHEGHLSSALCHLGNISYRLGKTLDPSEMSETIKNYTGMQETFHGFKDHLFSNWVDLSSDLPVLGPCLKVDAEKERFIEKEKYGSQYWANHLVKDEYRSPFLVPNTV